MIQEIIKTYQSKQRELISQPIMNHTYLFTAI